jgi:hypothetical protein
MIVINTIEEVAIKKTRSFFFNGFIVTFSILNRAYTRKGNGMNDKTAITIGENVIPAKLKSHIESSNVLSHVPRPLAF